MLNLPALLQNKNTRIGPFPWKRSVLQNPDRERTNESTGTGFAIYYYYLFPIYNKVISGIKGILLLSRQHLVNLAHVFNNYSCLVTVSVKIMPNQNMSWNISSYLKQNKLANQVKTSTYAQTKSLNKTSALDFLSRFARKVFKGVPLTVTCKLGSNCLNIT